MFSARIDTHFIRTNMTDVPSQTAKHNTKKKNLLSSLASMGHALGIGLHRVPTGCVVFTPTHLRKSERKKFFWTVY